MSDIEDGVIVPHPSTLELPSAPWVQVIVTPKERKFIEACFTRLMVTRESAVPAVFWQEALRQVEKVPAAVQGSLEMMEWLEKVVDGMFSAGGVPATSAAEALNLSGKLQALSGQEHKDE